MKKYMFIKERCEFKASDVNTKHLFERNGRLKAYASLMSTNFIDCFIVDKKHVNGDEVHCLNNKGLVYIYNLRSKRLITILHARSAQIARYYEATNTDVTREVLSLMYDNDLRNKKMNLNNA